MCLAVPARVVSIQGKEAEVELSGASYKTYIYLTPEVKVGDYVLLHTGYAISIIDKEEAEQTLELFRQLEGFSQDES
jgi:hydrogenase expression/formation protein HypC